MGKAEAKGKWGRTKLLWVVVVDDDDDDDDYDDNSIQFLID
jgi:hypothetical protein